MKKITANLPLFLALILSLVLTALTTSASAPQGSDTTGQSSTLLADGQLLILGGDSHSSWATAFLRNPETGIDKPLAQGLAQARVGHSATLLPDGTVLILGGLDEHGRAIATPEMFDPRTETFRFLSAVKLTPRTHHSATLLTDGRVIIAGGTNAAGRLTRTLEVQRALIDYIQPGKPNQNAFIERFSRTYREEDSIDSYFVTSPKCARSPSQRLQGYNYVRPHDALSGVSPTMAKLKPLETLLQNCPLDREAYDYN